MASELPRGSETVLLVDDDDHVRTVTSRILEGLGYRVLQAATPDQALHLATLSSAHLLIMDVILPGMSGLALAHKITTLRPGIRVLYFSAYASSDLLEGEIHPRPGVGLLKKPFTIEELAHSIRDFLDIPLPPPHEASRVPGGTESILVVHEDAQLRRFIVRTLERLGYHILEAQFPDRAITIAANARVDLVLVDEALPGLDGFALAKAVREGKPHLRFLFVSGEMTEARDDEALPSGEGLALLRRPFTAEELGRAVRAALGGAEID